MRGDTDASAASLGPTMAGRARDEAEVVGKDDVATVRDGGRIGRYVIRGELGRGGMGRVLRAFDPKLHRNVALKEVHRRQLGSEGARRLVAEARAMARLSHPNVVALHDVVEVADHDGVVLVMECVDGRTLTAWLRGARPWPEIVACFHQAGQGLAAAHAAGLLHRDFKPDNVLVGVDGRVRVTDFGLAREIGPAPTALEPASFSWTVPLTAPGAVIGTLHYLAPERLFGTPADASTDQYAFCASLWEALFGRRPFAGQTIIELASAMAQGPPAVPHGAAVPPWVVAVLLRGLHQDPGARWPTMDALLAALAPARASTGSRRLAWTSWRTRVVLVGAAMGIGAVVYGVAPNDEDASHAVERPATSDAPPAPVVAPVDVGAAKPDVGAAAPRLDLIEVRAAASPPTAVLYLDGVPLAGNPAVTTIARDAAAHRVEARASGHETGVAEIVADDDRNVVLQLSRVEDPPARRRTKAKKTDLGLSLERTSPWQSP